MVPSRATRVWRTLLAAGAWHAFIALASESPASEPGAATPVQSMVRQYCADCHDADVRKGDLDLGSIERDEIAKHPETWEKVVRKLRTRQMPPVRRQRPAESEYIAALSSLESVLDQAAAAHPNPGRTGTFRRLNRTEYQNAIRDLLAVEVDAASLLPRDESSHGFDNGSAGELTPTLLDRYISAAQKISRLAVGSPQRAPGGETYRLPPDLTQESRVEELPVGTRGGTLIRHTFPRDGEYDIQIRLTRDRNEEVEGLTEPHELELLVDRRSVKVFTVAPPQGRHKDFETVDAHLKVRIPIEAGLHEVGVTFLQQTSALIETLRQPYNAHFNHHRHPRLSPAVYQVSINGPYNPTGPGHTASRDRIFSCTPTGPENEGACAERILSTLMRRAYRRPVTASDLKRPMAFYNESRAYDGFEGGIEAALSAILVSPEFLFRIEREPLDAPQHAPHRISDLDLASRLSFFLWSSIPDDELLERAIQGDLHDSAVLRSQVERMLADNRSKALSTDFAAQWLHVRNLDSITPDLRLFPDFDDNLRQAFRKETELFFNSVLREDRSARDLLKSGETFLNERLARHYGIPHVLGSRFRRVSLDSGSQRGGLLRQGSVLTVTSYATRTSPVIRGKWILDNLLGTPPNPPLPNVPALKDNTVTVNLSVRARLAEHRANPACASCHDVMDPAGFSLENFDAVGRWRTLEEGEPIDCSGGLPDGSLFSGVSGLEHGLMERPELFVTTLTEKLMTYALGRGLESFDAPAVRQIVRDAESQDFRFSSIIVGIAESVPFTIRNSP